MSPGGQQPRPAGERDEAERAEQGRRCHDDGALARREHLGDEHEARHVQALCGHAGYSDGVYRYNNRYGDLILRTISILGRYYEAS